MMNRAGKLLHIGHGLHLRGKVFCSTDVFASEFGQFIRGAIGVIG
jgi:hypothetical protein